MLIQIDEASFYWIFGIFAGICISFILVRMFLKWWSVNRKRYFAQCGHLTRKKDTVTAFGKIIECEIPLHNGFAEYCHACLAKMAIRCAWCGEPIFIGDPITLYSPNSKDVEMPKYAVPYENGTFVGCLRWNCADSGADRSGFWMPPDEVYRVLSPMEQCLRSGDVVVVGDLSDVSQAVPFEG